MGFLKINRSKIRGTEEKILKEDLTRHTFEKAEFSWRTINENKIQGKKAILVCKAYHSTNTLLTYQSVFPKDVEKIKIVMGEVLKTGKYFQTYIYKFR